jgi:hypothetical protein
MPELRVTSVKQLHDPEGPPGIDGYQWRVTLVDTDEAHEEQILVDLSGSAAVTTNLGTTELRERVPAALQKYADGVLTTTGPRSSRSASGTAP